MRRIALYISFITAAIILLGCEKSVSKEINNAEVGDVVEFGNYNWKSKWIVLDKKNDDLLLISEEVMQPNIIYDRNSKSIDDYANGVRWDIATWETSELRKWLNTTFFEEAFSIEEKAMIKTTQIQTSDNPETGVSGGNMTQDMVFILSADEAENYFATDKERDCGTWWYLRTPGINCFFNPAKVDYGGVIRLDGSISAGPTKPGGVRPSVWVHITE